MGIVGRTRGHIRLTVGLTSNAAPLVPEVEAATTAMTPVNTDEWRAEHALARPHVTVCHQPGPREGARDADGDGYREGHSHTIAGLGTGLRNFLRPFRGVHKQYWHHYVAVFAWAYTLKRVPSDFLRLLLCPFISLPS